MCSPKELLYKSYVDSQRTNNDARSTTQTSITVPQDPTTFACECTVVRWANYPLERGY